MGIAEWASSSGLRIGSQGRVDWVWMYGGRRAGRDGPGKSSTRKGKTVVAVWTCLPVCVDVCRGIGRKEGAGRERCDGRPKARLAG